MHDECRRIPPGEPVALDGPGPGSSRTSVHQTDCNQAARLANILALARSGREFAVVSHAGGGDCSTDVAIPESSAGRFQCMTSGSSAKPKIVRRTHHSWIASFAVNRHLWSIGHVDSYAVLGNLSHSLPLYASLEAAHLGADLHMLSGMRPDRQFKALSERKVSILYATPTQIRLLTDGSARKRSEPALSVRLVLIGGSKLDAETMRSARRILPNAHIHEFYGSAETSFVTIGDKASPKGSVGRPYPGVGIRIGPGAQPGMSGEVWVRSPYLFEGYVGDSPGSSRWDGSYFSVGEIGRLDRKGNLELLGRVDRMVTVADRNVHPESIETWLMQQDGISNSAVLAEPDRLRGNRLTAFVEPAAGMADVEMLERKCRLALAPLATPDRFMIRKNWPILPSGKTDLAALASSLRKSGD